MRRDYNYIMSLYTLLHTTSTGSANAGLHPCRRRSRIGWLLGGLIALLAPLLALGLAPSAWAEHCRVLHVHDGDTLTLRCRVHSDQPARLQVRVWGIDAPELDQGIWGLRARDRMRDLADGWVELESVDRDDYGRTVGRIYRGHLDLGLAMVRDGYATVYRHYNRDSAYRHALHEAQRERLGIWTRPGLQQEPWEWRHQHERPWMR